MNRRADESSGGVSLLVKIALLLIVFFIIVPIVWDHLRGDTERGVKDVRSCSTFGGFCADECPAGYIQQAGKKGTVGDASVYGCPPQEMPSYYEGKPSQPDIKTLGYCCIPTEPQRAQI